MMKPKEIRRQARMTLQGNYFFAVNLTISLTIFTLALTIVLQSTSLGESPLPLNRALFWILNMIVMILNSLLTIGLIRYLYSLCKKEPIVQPWFFRIMISSAIYSISDTICVENNTVWLSSCM